MTKIWKRAKNELIQRTRLFKNTLVTKEMNSKDEIFKGEKDMNLNATVKKYTKEKRGRM